GTACAGGVAWSSALRGGAGEAPSSGSRIVRGAAPGSCRVTEVSVIAATRAPLTTSPTLTIWLFTMARSPPGKFTIALSSSWAGVRGGGGAARAATRAAGGSPGAKAKGSRVSGAAAESAGGGGGGRGGGRGAGGRPPRAGGGRAPDPAPPPGHRPRRGQAKAPRPLVGRRPRLEPARRGRRRLEAHVLQDALVPLEAARHL